jgi:hypothetical protein
VKHALAETELPGPAARTGSSPAARALGAACLGAAVLALFGARRRAGPQPRPRDQSSAAKSEAARQPSSEVSIHVASDAARSLHRAAGLLAFSVLADSAIEHYRGGFENPGMFAPLVTSLATMLVSLHAARSASAPAASPAVLERLACAGQGLPAQAGTRWGRRTESRNRSSAIYTVAVALGAAGSAFHLYNVARRPGGFCWQNLFYAAPLGAPAALGLSGLFGLAARRIQTGGADPRLLGWPAGRTLAALAGAGIAGTSAEAALLHFRGAFHRPAMWLPVTLPPVAAALMLRAATGAGRRLARAWLDVTALLGVAGLAFHAGGVARQMGGWSNWQQNVQSGPPLPAPPSFLALALAGRAALALAMRDPDLRRSR